MPSPLLSLPPPLVPKDHLPWDTLGVATANTGQASMHLAARGQGWRGRDEPSGWVTSHAVLEAAVGIAS